ncbi:hypothetical protein Pla175_03860 [Pirellulimonas nuda]|uniref:Uncharacterized protein n=1 Tax=Pirellulimonas nuda TaxID=2528009 RepID=A0A518D6C9_9BACT|nr:hypothetical protein [Pirellulimonas nuda]QDU87032.1 hypothetical protein Pla175_03860 [Pirellulimonas nuda]
MGIRVECPNGHVLNIKEKYAGKKGLCPKCPGQVFVHVPDVTEVIQRAVDESEQRTSAAGSSVFDEAMGNSEAGDSGSASLLSGSVIRHHIRCECGSNVPMWYAKCPTCGRFLEH